MIDLDLYFARIGHRGARTPTLETLNAIVNAHVQAIPFENLLAVLEEHFGLRLPPGTRFPCEALDWPG